MDPSPHSPLQPFLRRLLSHSELAEAERQAILALPAQPDQVQTNRDFVKLGEQVTHASFVVAGLVGCFGQNREGNRQITAVHLPTDMINLHSVVAPEACSALQALTVTTILRVPHRALRDAALRHPGIAEAFWRECAIDAAVLSEWVVNVGRRDARSRLAHLLCEMACRTSGGCQEVAHSFDFPATQTHIADMLGLTPVHVNRVLQALKRGGLIATEGRTIHILDWDGLVRAGDFDAGYLHVFPAQAAARPVDAGVFLEVDFNGSAHAAPEPIGHPAAI